MFIITSAINFTFCESTNKIFIYFFSLYTYIVYLFSLYSLSVSIYYSLFIYVSLSPYLPIYQIFLFINLSIFLSVSPMITYLNISITLYSLFIFLLLFIHPLSSLSNSLSFSKKRKSSNKTH